MNVKVPNTIQDRRQQFNVEIRKKKNEKLFMTKRKKLMSNSDPLYSNISNDPKQLEAILTELRSSFSELVVFLDDLPFGHLINNEIIYKPSEYQWAELTKKVSKVRFCISLDNSSAMDPTIIDLFLSNKQILNNLLELTRGKYASQYELQRELIWIFANLCAVDDQSMVEKLEASGIVVPIKDFLDSSDSYVLEYTFLALGNLIHKNRNLRDYLIEIVQINKKIEFIISNSNDTFNNKDTDLIESILYFIVKFTEIKPYKDWDLLQGYLNFAIKGIFGDDKLFVDFSLTIIRQICLPDLHGNFEALFEIKG